MERRAKYLWAEKQNRDNILGEGAALEGRINILTVGLVSQKE